MLIKICGITSCEDARLVLGAGADWIGINLVAGPRRVGVAEAVRIVESVDDPGRVVALIEISGGQADGPVLRELGACGVSRVQVYGEVTPSALEQVSASGSEIIMVKQVAGIGSLDHVGEILGVSGAHRPGHVLLDSPSRHQLGGTGVPADWELIGRARDEGRFDDWPPVILAGGLRPDNVAEAIRVVRPAGVDVCSGVEASAGVKDRKLVEGFISCVRSSEL